jgi:hypothetical protein
VEAILATVDDKKKVVLVTSRFDIVNIPIVTKNVAMPEWVKNLQIQNGVSPGDKDSKAFGLRFGDLEELRQQQTDWSRWVASNSGLKSLLTSIDQPGDENQKKADAEAFMSFISPFSKQDNGTFAVGGETDIILLGPKGAFWQARKANCPETWKP